MRKYFRLVGRLLRGLRMSYGVWKIDEDYRSGKSSLNDIINPVVKVKWSENAKNIRVPFFSPDGEAIMKQFNQYTDPMPIVQFRAASWLVLSYAIPGDIELQADYQT